MVNGDLSTSDYKHGQGPLVFLTEPLKVVIVLSQETRVLLLLSTAIPPLRVQRSYTTRFL